MKLPVAWCLTALLLGGFTACGTGTALSSTPSIDGDDDLAPMSDEAKKKLLVPGSGTLPWRIEGRSSPGVEGLGQPQRLSWPQTTVWATFAGTSIQTSFSSSGTNIFEIAVDGGTPARFDPRQGQARFANLDPNVPHTVRLTKITETTYGTALFRGFTLDADAQLTVSPAASSRRLTIIGDSISAGYGSAGDSALCKGTADNEDSSVAYGTVLARAMGAELQLLAWSGKGVYRNNNALTVETMSQIWTRAVASDPNTPYNAGYFIPQAVIINLGTNDYYPGQPEPRAFQNAYLELLAAVRAAYPDAHIICMVGPLLYGSGLVAASSNIQAVVRSRNAAGDARVYVTQIPTQKVDPNTGAGAACEYHPNVQTHRAMASALRRQLRQLLGW